MEKRFNNNFVKKDNDTPGPGNYHSSKQTFGRNVKGVAIINKNSPRINPVRNPQLPGPGQYNNTRKQMV